MKRILQIGMTDNLGGIETFLMNYYRHIDKDKIQFDFINIYKNKLCFEDEIKSLGGKIYKLSSYYKHPIKYIKELKEIIKTNNYQIIHCNMNSAVMLYPLIAAKLAKAKIIISHSHNSSSDKGLLKKILHNINKHFIPYLANTYFACSTLAGEWFFNKKIITSSNFYIINNAIETTEYLFNNKTRENKRKDLNINNDEIIIGHVGRFTPQKNHKYLIDIFNALQSKNNKVKLMLIGIGPLMDNIKQKVKSLKLENKVLFLNQRSDINELYQTMDLFILPSLYEGLPLVGIEAQVSGLPCLFSSSITKELKLSENANYLDLSESPNMWAEEIQKIINTKHPRKIVNIDNFDIIKNTRKLERIYLEKE